MYIGTYPIEYTPHQPVTIAAIFDAHIGALACDEDLLRRDVKTIAAMPHTYAILGGDNNDSIVVTDKRYRASERASANVDDLIDYDVDLAADIFSPLKGRILGVMEGNHESKITGHCGTNPAKRLARRLEADFWGYSALARVILREPGKGRRGRTIVIHTHHGYGGGSRTRGASLTKYDRDRSSIEADIFLRGHDHKRQTDDPVILSHGGNTLVAKTQLLCLCGTYLKTFSETADSTYSERSMFPPTALGCVLIHMQVNSRRPSPHKPGAGWVDLWTTSGINR